MKSLISGEQDFVAGQLYSYRNTNGEDFLVQLSADVVKQAGKGQERSVRRLLAALLTSPSGQNGIKPLFDIGKDIVEIKAVMRGHWRLIGCLRGRKLEIKKLYDMGESRASYQKTLPANFCN